MYPAFRNKLRTTWDRRKEDDLLFHEKLLKHYRSGDVDNTDRRRGRSLPLHVEEAFL